MGAPVGDIITTVKNSAEKPLPGFKESHLGSLPVNFQLLR